MRYAYYPGCVAKSSAPELYTSTTLVAEGLGIELVELTAASCCGAGVVDEADPLLSVTLNARTFAMAEEMGLDILTICSTCQGVMRQVKWRLDGDSALAERANAALGEVDRRYRGEVEVKHLLQVLAEDYPPSELDRRIVRPLGGLRAAPFYGCYILRPAEALGIEDHENPTSLERLITALGGEPVRYEGETKCCGFPLLFVQRGTAFEMTARYVREAKERGADVMVTPCPLCHISLDTYQDKAARQAGLDLGVPILHLPQLVGLALGVEPGRLGLSRHMVPPGGALGRLRGASSPA